MNRNLTPRPSVKTLLAAFPKLTAGGRYGAKAIRELMDTETPPVVMDLCNEVLAFMASNTFRRGTTAAPPPSPTAIQETPTAPRFSISTEDIESAAGAISSNAGTTTETSTAGCQAHHLAPCSGHLSGPGRPSSEP